MTDLTSYAVCPHCGNTDRARFEDNGCSRGDVEFTMLCVARVAPGESSIRREDEEIGADGRTDCGMQWMPSAAREEAFCDRRHEELLDAGHSYEEIEFILRRELSVRRRGY